MGFYRSAPAFTSTSRPEQCAPALTNEDQPQVFDINLILHAVIDVILKNKQVQNASFRTGMN